MTLFFKILAYTSLWFVKILNNTYQSNSTEVNSVVVPRSWDAGNVASSKIVLRV